MHTKTKILLFILTIYVCTSLNLQSTYASEPPELNASIAILTEMGTGKILYAKNVNQRAYPASMTKILTALVFVEHVDIDEVIVTGSEVHNIPSDSSRVGHKQGESVTGLNLLRALLLRSGNETGNVMAAAVAKKITGHSLPFTEAEALFVDLMNEKAKDLGAVSSNFKNAHGYHDDDHYTTAKDLALICQAAMENKIIADVVAETEYQGNGAEDKIEEGMVTQEYNWRTTNSLLLRGTSHYSYATGIKTGFTDQAGYCFAGSAQKDGVRLISIVFNDGESDRFDDTIKLFDYGFDNHTYEYIQSQGEILDTVELYDPPIGIESKMEIVAAESFRDFFSYEDLEKIERQIIYMEDKIFVPEDDGENEEDKDEKKTANTPVQILLPISQGEKIGTVQYILNKTVIFEEDIFSSRQCEERSYKTDSIYYYNLFIDNAFTLKALPGWIFIFSIVILLIFFISSIIKRRIKKDYYRLKKRY